MKKLLVVGLFFYLAFLIFTRFYNVEHTAHFTEDESGFLVRTHQIYQERKITLVGQVNELGTKVFSSLTVYLLLPFAILGKFDPASVFYGAAFWGVLTGLVMLWLGRLINKKIFWLTAILILVWFPLLQTGRWAWNPNFIPLWISLGIICYFQKKSVFHFLAGVFLGLSVHQHYYALFAIAFFALMVTIKALIKKDFKRAIFIDLGIILTLLPFIIFDLRHPPGIFILGVSKQIQNAQELNFFNNLINHTFETLKYYVQSMILVFPLILGIIVLLVYDIYKKKKALFFLLPGIFQIIAVSTAAPYGFHYFFPIIPFFFVWLIFHREKFGKILSLMIISILIIGGSFKLIPFLKTSPVQPDLTTVKKIDKILEAQIKERNLKNVNIAVLSSPDPTNYGRKYRDLLLIPDNVQILSREVSDYDITDNLFVISTSSEEIIREDVAFEIDNFRYGLLRGRWPIDNTSWIVYLLTRNEK